MALFLGAPIGATASADPGHRGGHGDRGHSRSHDGGDAKRGASASDGRRGSDRKGRTSGNPGSDNDADRRRPSGRDCPPGTETGTETGTDTETDTDGGSGIELPQSIVPAARSALAVPQTQESAPEALAPDTAGGTGAGAGGGVAPAPRGSSGRAVAGAMPRSSLTRPSSRVTGSPVTSPTSAGAAEAAREVASIVPAPVPTAQPRVTAPANPVTGSAPTERPSGVPMAATIPVIPDPVGGLASRLGYQPEIINTGLATGVVIVAVSGVAGILVLMAGGGVLGYRRAIAGRRIGLGFAGRFMR